MFILLMAYKGVWHYRCNDGEWRVDPWFGTYGSCCKVYKTMGGAKGAKTRLINNGWQTQGTHFWITALQPSGDSQTESCADLWQRVRKESTGQR